MPNKRKGKTNGIPISFVQYGLGIILFLLFHLKARFLLLLKGKRLTHQKAIRSFHSFLFRRMFSSIIKREGISIHFRLPWTAITLVVLTLLIFSYWFMHFDNASTGYWDTYISAPALVMLNRPVDFTYLDGNSVYSYTLPGSLPENLVDHETYGVISKDQRIGSAIFFAPYLLFFNLLGFRLLYALSIALTFLLIYAAERAVGISRLVSIIVSFLAIANSYIISIRTLNPNIIGFFLISLILMLILNRCTNFFLIGLLFGILGGIRNIAILYSCAILFYLFCNSQRRFRNIFLFVLGAGIGIAPILFWKQFAFGSFLMHPSQFAHHDGFRPVFEHTLLFWKFSFNGMFNFPLHSEIIRTPYFTFPTFLTIPLLLLRTFGLLAAVCVIYGFYRQMRSRFSEWFFLLLWFAPMFVLFCLQENWSEMKTTFLFLFIHPLLIWLGVGIHTLIHSKRKKRHLIQFSILVLIFFISVKFISFLYFPVDMRWYKRFPRALHNNIFFLGDDLRNEPESLEKLSEQRRFLTRGNLLPHFNTQALLTFKEFNAIKEEMHTHTLKTIDFWKYIYNEELQ